jgi:iron complex transport system ATP-binding protein
VTVADLEHANGSAHPSLTADALTLAYDRVVVRDLSVTVLERRISAIVGPNASGKSTLLKGLARLLRPASGAVLLDGQSIQRLPTKVVARRLGILPQSSIAPDGITVADLVARGRYPHQSWLRQWSREDDARVSDAMRRTEVLDLADRPVDELSGGQRQRAWIAMALAQGSPLMLLDEPTTFLDVAHQIEVLDLLVDLNREEGRTIVLVLHDLNHAARYADHLVVMGDGEIVAQGRPPEIVTDTLIGRIFGLRCRVVADPVTGSPLVVPISRHQEAPHTAPERTKRVEEVRA